MFEALERINERPEPFAFYTANDLWTDAHTSSQMLSFHLNETIDVSSRNAAFIDRSVKWIASKFDIGKDTKIADFGCGPGLYATRLAKRRAEVTGIDFSGRSIEYAKNVASREKLNISYVLQNYLDFETQDRFDLVLMIMCDYCALSPTQRKEILNKFHRILKPDGSVLLDVYSLSAFDQREEVATYEVNLLNGFWSPNKYYGFLNTVKYDEEKVALDKYTIVEPERTRTVFNWLQYFSPEDLGKEFQDAGFCIEGLYSDVMGTPYDRNSDEFAVIAKRAWTGTEHQNRQIIMERGTDMKTSATGRYDIGKCRSVRIKCVSELGWFDSERVLEQMMEAGGPETSQWDIPWDIQNAAGCCSLVDMEAIDGSRHKFLMDTGWNNQYMDEAFAREGIDKMLTNGEIEFLIITHEHLDHYWGLETTLRYNPEIKIIIPDTFSSEGLSFLKGAEFSDSNTRNVIPHRGNLIKTGPGIVNKLYEGCACVAFDLPILMRVRGEQSLFFNVQDKGIVCVTGCCHQSILALADFARENIVGGDTIYGVYGGLHIAPFGPMNSESEHIVREMGKYNFSKIACNHCTGISAVEKMVELGYPIVRGTGSFGSKSDLYIGNGDQVVFG